MWASVCWISSFSCQGLGLFLSCVVSAGCLVEDFFLIFSCRGMLDYVGGIFRTMNVGAR
jgi:hypothetical protein